jgi:beta-galactosidase
VHPRPSAPYRSLQFLLLSTFLIALPVALSSQPHGAHSVSFDERGLVIDGKYFPLVSGEFHYWRHNPIFWKKILQTMKDAGLEIVSTYIPWNFHELTPGTFDFDGKTNPARDLPAFLELCQDMGLKVIVRPGPFIAAEWPNGGLPDDLTNIDHLDPKFFERSKQWISAVCGVLAPYQYTRGGPIVLYQIENEIFFPGWTKPSKPYGRDQQAYTYDVEFVMGKYRSWLEAEYKSIEEFNKVNGLQYKNFAEVPPPNFRKDPLSLSLNSWGFVSDAIMDYFRNLKDEFVRGGMEVPCYANIGQFVVFYDYQRMERIVNSVGLDLYMFNLLPGEEALVVNWYNRLFAARQKFPWSPEFQCGIWRSWSDQTGFITGRHQEYLTLLSLATGLRGFNYYMFVNRDRWSYSAVDELGEPEFDGKYDVLKRDIALAKQLTHDTHLAAVGLIWHLAHNQKHLIDKYKDWQEAGNYFLDRQGPKETAEWWSTFAELTRMDADFDLVVLPTGDLSRYSAVIYAGPDFIDNESFKKLSDYLKQGGTLLVTSGLPRKNLELKAPPEIKTFAKGIENSRNLRTVSPQELQQVFSDLKILRFVSTEGNGILSNLFKGIDGRYTLFLVNTSDSARVATYEMDPGLFTPGVRYVRKDLLSGDTQIEIGSQFTRASAALPPKQVLVYTFSPSP